MADFDAWRGLLGEDVIVTLDHPAEGREQVVARGRLIAFDDGGEARLVDEMGFVHYCWPMLNVVKMSEGAAPAQSAPPPSDAAQSGLEFFDKFLFDSDPTTWPDSST